MPFDKPAGGGGSVPPPAPQQVGGAHPGKYPADLFIEEVVRDAAPLALAAASVVPGTLFSATLSFFGFTGGFGKPIRPTLLAMTNFLPQPAGLVPPKVYGLPPNYLGTILPFLPDSAYLQSLPPEDPRVSADLAAKAHLAIQAGDVFGPAGTVAVIGATQGNQAAISGAASIFAGVNEALNLVVSPPTNNFLADTVIGQSLIGTTPNAPLAAAAPADLAAVAGVLALGSFLPGLFKSTVQSALTNEAGKKGLDKELIHERADP